MRAPQAKLFLNFWNLAFQNKKRKWMENELTSPYKIYPPPEIKNTLTSPKNPKFQLPLTLAGGAHYDMGSYFVGYT